MLRASQHFAVLTRRAPEVCIAVIKAVAAEVVKIDQLPVVAKCLVFARDEGGVPEGCFVVSFAVQVNEVLHPRIQEILFFPLRR